MENNKLLKVSPLSDEEMVNNNGGFILQVIILGLAVYGLFTVGKSIGDKFDDCPPCPDVVE